MPRNPTPHANISIMPDVVDPEVAVREYLLFLENPEQLVDTAKLDALKGVVDAATDPLERLKALAQLERAQRPRETEYREAFIANVKTWADANAVTGSTFLTVGVDRSALQAAGLLPGKRGRRRAGTPGSSKSTTTAAIKHAILQRSGTFTLVDVSNEAGGSPMTVRKAVTQLIDAGQVERVGPHPDWRSQGRAPIIFRRL